MCRVLNVTRQGYYAWRQRPISQRQQRRDELAEKAEQVFEASGGRYGSPRVYRQMVQDGERCSVNTIAKIMQDRGLRASESRRFVPRTTDSQHDHPVAPNRLERDFCADRPNQVWVADITYLPTREGFLYLATVMDLYSRKIVGWSMADHLRAELACAALRMAIVHRQPPKGLIHHSDRGVQYASDKYRSLLNGCGLVQSMSRKGDCYDNAPMESWFSSFKRETIGRSVFDSHRQARAEVFEYVEVFYNRRRLHSALGYVSPAAYEDAAA